MEAYLQPKMGHHCINQARQELEAAAPTTGPTLEELEKRAGVALLGGLILGKLFVLVIPETSL